MRFKRKKYDHEYKSNSEYEAAQQLHKQKIKFVYEQEKLAYEWREDKNYIPDFFLPNGVILEVKGRFMIEDRKKHLFIKAQHPDLDIRFVFDNPTRK
jgi:hypothetical protein